LINITQYNIVTTWNSCCYQSLCSRSWEAVQSESAICSWSTLSRYFDGIRGVGAV